jgi:PAS domain S-box-containing protein
MPLAILVSGILLSLETAGASHVPVVWPPVALLAGWLIRTTWRPPLVLAAGAALTLVALLVGGVGLGQALGWSATSVLAATVLASRLTRHREDTPGLMVEGDVSRMIGAMVPSSLVGAVGAALTSASVGPGDWRLAALAGFGSCSATFVVVLPLFLRTPSFAPLAGKRERVLQAVITLATTGAVFGFSGSAAIIFAVMPMFAWHAFRGRLREASLVLVVVSLIGVVLTTSGIGPIRGFEVHYGVDSEIAVAVLQLFLLDCGLILLPLSVMTTQQRVSAAAAAAEQAKLERLVAQATGTAIITIGADGHVASFNSGAELVFGLGAQDVVGTVPDSLWKPEELQRQAMELRTEPTFASICAASVASGDVDRLWTLERPTGEQRTVRMSLTLIPDDSGTADGYLITAEDITDREATHVALVSSLNAERQALERLREAERVKSDLLATVSHELRTPLASILGYLEVLQDGAPGHLNDGQGELVERIYRNGRRLQTLVEDLLTMSAAETSSLSLDPSSTDLCAIVRQAERSLASTLATRRLDFRVFVPPRPLVREGDPVLLQRMITNLLSNAVKFTPDGGRIQLQLTDVAGVATIIVRDTGMGILEHEQKQLFSRFFRSTVARDRQMQGAGLGLPIVQTIVALHRGTIGIESNPGKGTTVTVTLPRLAADSTAEKVVAHA